MLEAMKHRKQPEWNYSFAEDYEMYRRRLENLIRVIKEKLEEIPYMDKLSSWRSRGITTVCGFVAEVGDIRYSVLYIIEL